MDSLPQGQDLSPLVREIVDELRVFPVFSGQRLLEFEDRCVNLFGAVARETFFDNREDPLSESHLYWSLISGSLQRILFSVYAPVCKTNEFGQSQESFQKLGSKSAPMSFFSS